MMPGPCRSASTISEFGRNMRESALPVSQFGSELDARIERPSRSMNSSPSGFPFSGPSAAAIEAIPIKNNAQTAKIPVFITGYPSERYYALTNGLQL